MKEEPKAEVGTKRSRDDDDEVQYMGERDYLGRRIRILLPGEGWFSGTVKSYSSRRGHQIEWDAAAGDDASTEKTATFKLTDASVEWKFEADE